jgi:membrane-bound lytic murein transglycosylase D
MKITGILVLLLAGMFWARAQDDTVSLPDLIDGVQTWAQENLDTNVLAALQQVDRQKVQEFFNEWQREFQGEYVVDLASLKDAAEAIMPLLESHPETRPYAAWLRSQLDYLQVADEFRITIPPPKVETNQPPLPIPNPGPVVEREIWIKKVADRPPPPGATNYLVRLKPVFAAQKVPPELLWVAEVESSFNADALSPAGAAGLFQLMPDTARRFGLSLWPRDQRLQPELSARASACYLKFLYDRFQDWRLALAGYNAGEGRVQRLLDRYRTRNYDEISPHLPAETQMYVPRVEAVLLRREGVKLAELTSPPDTGHPTIKP